MARKAGLILALVAVLSVVLVVLVVPPQGRALLTVDGAARGSAGRTTCTTTQQGRVVVAVAVDGPEPAWGFSVDPAGPTMEYLSVPFADGTSLVARPEQFRVSHRAGEWTVDGVGTLDGSASGAGSVEFRVEVRCPWS